MNAAEKIEKWMVDQVAAQKKLLETEDPVIVTHKVADKIKVIEDHLMKLIAKKKPKVQPKKEPVVPKNETEENKNTKEEEDGSKKAEEPLKTEVPSDASEEHEHDEL